MLKTFTVFSKFYQRAIWRTRILYAASNFLYSKFKKHVSERGDRESAAFLAGASRAVAAQTQSRGTIQAHPFPCAVPFS